MPDRRRGAARGRLYERPSAGRFMLPALPRRPAIFYRAVEIADLMFCLSLVDAGLITAEMHAEADRACTAYLGTYLPAVLPRRA